MSLVGKVGRRRPRARIAMAFLYLVLSLGALTMVYPFFLMVSTGLKGPTDQNDSRLVPAYLQVDDDLLAKYLNDKYAGDQSMVDSTRVGTGQESQVANYEKFLMSLPLDMWTPGFKTAPNQVTGRLQARYQNWLRDRFHGDLQALNRLYIEEAVDFQTVVPPAELLERKSWQPLTTPKYQDWLIFKASLPAEFRVPIRTQRLFQEWMRGKFQNQFTAVPPEVARGATKFEALALPAGGPLLAEFRAKSLPLRYRDGAAESRWKGGGELPIVPFEKAYVGSHASEIRREFASRNYGYVLDYILLNGRAVWNTLLFCLLAIGTQLVVNPLAAYALSRYPVKQSGAILIFLLATMAFPAEVAMIPSFLLLKDLGLLNTFAALVLPTAASGYMIFLLKGFFDSLPQELYEAGQLDGAPETTMMMRIALPLSRPVLGYLALLAFMGAYGAFIYAFLIAQDQRMWTLMVWIYQLQNSAPKAVMMAALTLAAVPTLVVFLCAQRVIMRGIVLPGER